MKKLMLFIIVLGLCSGAWAQGTLGVANSLSELVQTNDYVHGGAAATNAGYEVQLFYQPGSNPPPAPIYDADTGLVNFGAWEPMSGSPIVTVSIYPGRFSGGTETTGTDVVPGGNVWLEVLGWSGGAPSFMSAYLNGIDLVGASTVWSQITGGSGIPPTTPAGIGGANEFTGLIIGAPEPSVFALSGIGATCLLLFCRRK